MIHGETKRLQGKVQRCKLVRLSSTQASRQCRLQLSLLSRQRPVLRCKAHHLLSRFKLFSMGVEKNILFSSVCRGVRDTGKSKTWKEETDAVNSVSSAGYVQCCWSAPLEINVHVHVHFIKCLTIQSLLRCLSSCEKGKKQMDYGWCSEISLL